MASKSRVQGAAKPLPINTGSKSTLSGFKVQLDKWNSQILAGNLSEVIAGLHHSMDLRDVKPDGAVSILKTLSQLLDKMQRNKTEISPTASDVFELMILCGDVIGLSNADGELNVSLDHFKTILLSLHFAVYYFYNKGCHVDLLDLCPMILFLAKRIKCLPQNKQQEVLKTMKELANILWNASTRIEDQTAGLKMCCHSLSLLSVQEPSDIILLCNRVTRSTKIYGENSIQKVKSNLIETILGSVTFSPSNILKKEEEDAVETLLLAVVLHLQQKVEDSGVGRELLALQRLQQQGLISNHTLDAVMATFNAIATFSSHTDEKPVAECRCYVSDDLTGRVVARLVLNLSSSLIKNRKGWQDAPLALVRELQSLLLDCLPLAPSTMLIMAAYNIVKLAEREVPQELLADEWKDRELLGVTLACKAVRFVSKLFTELSSEQQQNDAFLLFQYVSYVAFKLNFHVSKCYFESHQVYEIFEEFVYSCIPSVISNTSVLTKLLDCILSSGKHANTLLSVVGGDREKRAKQAPERALLVLAAVTQSHQALPADTYHKMLQAAVAVWCDSRQKLGRIGPSSTKSHKSILSWWHEHKARLAERLHMQLTEPDWEEVLTQEVTSYPELQECEVFVTTAGEALEALTNKSEELCRWSRTTLALAFAKSKESDDGLVMSLSLSTLVLNRLQRECEKKKSRQLLAYLMEACFQIYITERKSHRKANEKLAEIPLLVRAPPQRSGPAGESHAVEKWEEGEELSQLGQVLSCRLESRSMYPLVTLLGHATTLVDLGQKATIPSNMTSALEILESVGYIFSTLGHHWLAMKSWGLLYKLAGYVPCPRRQLLVLSMIMARYALVTQSPEDVWLHIRTKELREELTKQQQSNRDIAFVLKFHDVCMARSLMISNKASEAADIVLKLLSELHPNDDRELMVRSRMLASQLMGALPPAAPQRQQLIEMELGPMEAANWATLIALRSVNTTNPAERNLKELRQQELMIDSSLWLATLARMMSSNRVASIALQALLMKLQRLMLPSRAAQVLSCLGDLDLMTPDEIQLSQRLYWNQKILSLGAAIKGSKEAPKNGKTKRTYTVGTSPTRFQKKEYQLTAFCSEKCYNSVAKRGCIFCKNPLYQLCKLHYAFLVEDNEETVLKLYSELEVEMKHRARRLWDLTWGQMIGKEQQSEESAQGWLPLLQAPLSLLDCRQRLIMASMQADKGFPREALEATTSVVARLRVLQHEAAPLLRNWALAQLATHHIQCRGIGMFSSKLKAPSQLPAPSAHIEEVVSPPLVPSTPRKPVAVPAPAPKKPRRKAASKTETAPTLPTIPRPKAPKLVLPEISPNTKAKMLFTFDSPDTSVASETSSRAKKGKENLENVPPNNLKLVHSPVKSFKKPLIKTESNKPESSLVFSILQDYSKPPVKNQYSVKSNSSTLSSRKAKPVSKLEATLDNSPIPVSSKKSPKFFRSSSAILSPLKSLSPSPNDSPIMPPKSSTKLRKPILESSPETPIQTSKSTTKPRKKLPTNSGCPSTVQKGDKEASQKKTYSRICVVDLSTSNSDESPDILKTKMSDSDECSPEVKVSTVRAARTKSRLPPPTAPNSERADRGTRQKQVSSPKESPLASSLQYGRRVRRTPPSLLNMEEAGSTIVGTSSGESLGSRCRNKIPEIQKAKPRAKLQKDVPSKKKQAVCESDASVVLDSDVSLIESSIIEEEPKKTRNTRKIKC